MKTPISDIAFTPAVKAQQERLGSRRSYAKVEEKGGWNDRGNDDLETFIAARDSFYLGTASADGRPYIQHRGGAKGFLRILDPSTLAFADYAGNKQYISMGNLAENDQAYIFLMDYPNRRRVKIWGRAEIIEDDPALLERLLDPGYKARPERVFVFHIEAWDVNWPVLVDDLDGTLHRMLDTKQNSVHILESDGTLVFRALFAGDSAVQQAIEVIYREGKPHKNQTLGKMAGPMKSIGYIEETLRRAGPQAYRDVVKAMAVMAALARAFPFLSKAHRGWAAAGTLMVGMAAALVGIVELF